VQIHTGNIDEESSRFQVVAALIRGTDSLMVGLDKYIYLKSASSSLTKIINMGEL
jgi:hypothetical protein